MKNTCPLQNQCQTPNLIYKADVENEINNETKIYFGMAAITFEERFQNHKKSLNHKQHSKNTELLKYVWFLKNAKIPYSLIGPIVEKVNGKKIDRCHLCLAEKLHLIEYFDDIWLLSKRSEFINHYRRQNKHYLKVLFYCS